MKNRIEIYFLVFRYIFKRIFGTSGIGDVYENFYNSNVYNSSNNKFGGKIRCYYKENE